MTWALHQLETGDLHPTHAQNKYLFLKSQSLPTTINDRGTNNDNEIHVLYYYYHYCNVGEQHPLNN